MKCKSLAGLLCITSFLAPWVHAESILTVGNVNVKAGNVVTIPIDFENGDSVVGLQFDLFLPIDEIQQIDVGECFTEDFKANAISACRQKTAPNNDVIRYLLVKTDLSPLPSGHLSTTVAFGQEADLSIELEVRPSPFLAVGQLGLLDVIITNHGPGENSGTIEITNLDGFPPVIFGDVVAGQCKASPVFEPPPPGVPFFWPLDTPVLSAGEMVVCTIAFQLDGRLPLSTIITMSIFSNQYPDPNQSNDVASITVTFLGTQPVPAIGSIALWILGGLILLFVGIKGFKNANPG